MENTIVLKTPNHEYPVPKGAIPLSMFLQKVVKPETTQVDIPAQFEDMYMHIIHQYLTTYTKNPVAKPIKDQTMSSSSVLTKLIHKGIHDMLIPFKTSDLEQFRPVAYFFGIRPLVHACDILITSQLIKQRESAFPHYHVGQMTHASKSALVAKYPMFEEPKKKK